MITITENGLISIIKKIIDNKKNSKHSLSGKDEKLVNLAIKFLNQFYGGLELYKPIVPDEFLYLKKDNEFIVQHKKNVTYVSIDLYKDLLSFGFGLKLQQFEYIVKVWLENEYKLKVKQVIPSNIIE